MADVFELLNESETPAEAAADAAEAEVVEAEVEAAEEAVVEAEVSEAEPPAKAEKTISLAAHIKEREKLKTRIADLEQERKATGLSPEDADLLKELRSLRDQAKTRQEAAPDFAQDPKGYVDWAAKQQSAALEKLEKANKEASERHQQTEQQLQQQARMSTVLTAVQAQEVEFAKQHTDYPDALNHARQVRTKQLGILFPEATEQQVAQQIAVEEIQAAERLLQQGRNPVEFVYDYAKTLGFQSKLKPASKPVDKSAVRSLGAAGSSAEAGEDEGDDDGLGEFRDVRAEQKALAARFSKR